MSERSYIGDITFVGEPLRWPRSQHGINGHALLRHRRILAHWLRSAGEGFPDLAPPKIKSLDFYRKLTPPLPDAS